MSEKTVHDWRACLLSSGLPPTTRHVLVTLSLHMDINGESCYPTIDQLVYETGLGRSTVIRHLQEAEIAGWLIRDVHGYGGREWRNHEYRSDKPDGFEYTPWKKSEAYKSRFNNGPKKRPPKPLRGGPANGPREDKVVPQRDEGGPANASKVVPQRDTSTSLSTSGSTPAEKAVVAPKYQDAEDKTPSPVKKTRELKSHEFLTTVAQLFNDNLPQHIAAKIPQPLAFNRIGMIRDIIRENPKFSKPELWDWYFSGIDELDFYNGKGGRKPFKAGLDYFLKPETFTTVYELVEALAEGSES